MEIMAPAKLNLYLGVFGKREDGFHEIGTLFERVSIFDRITLEISSVKTSITARGADIPTGEDSLLGKTIAAFRLFSGDRSHFKVNIEKNIPVAAGMGGGSSDAASLLMGLNSLTGTPLDSSEMLKIAGTLGADVPFFLTDSSFALGTGRGDQLIKVDTDLKLGHLIVNPPLVSSTKTVYGRVSGFNLTTHGAWDTMLALFLKELDLRALSEYLRNDLQQIVLQDFPVLEDVISFLDGLGAKKAMMTGSGPTVFGIFNKETLKDAVKKAKNRFPEQEGWRVYEAFTV